MRYFSEKLSRERYQLSPTRTFCGRCWRDTGVLSLPSLSSSTDSFEPRRLGTKPGSPQQAAPGPVSSPGIAWPLPPPRKGIPQTLPPGSRLRTFTQAGKAADRLRARPTWPEAWAPGGGGTISLRRPGIQDGGPGTGPGATVTKVAAGGEASQGTWPPRAGRVPDPMGCAGDEDIHSCPAGSWDIYRH